MSGVFTAVSQIYRKSGIFGIYKGHTVTLARIFPYAAINFAAFEKFKSLLNSDKQSSNWPWRKLIAGSLAGALSVSITYPFDIIRARVAYDLSHKKPEKITAETSVRSAVNQLSFENRTMESKIPLRGFYQGFVPTILGIIPYAGVSFFVFETSKHYLMNLHDVKELPSIEIFASGLLAGALGQTVAYPFDVIRRRMQLYRITEHLPHHHYSSGFMQALKSVIRTHGWSKGIFSGLSINYLKVAPASGISFLVYDTLKKHF